MVSNGTSTEDTGLWEDSNLLARLSKCLDNCSVASSDNSSSYDLIQKLTDTLGQEYGDSTSTSQSQSIYDTNTNIDFNGLSHDSDRSSNGRKEMTSKRRKEQERIIYEDDYEEEQYQSQQQQSGTSRKNARPTSPIVQLPNRPTPYEIWASKHHTSEESKRNKVLTKQGLQHLLDKLTTSAIEKNRIAQQKQHRDLANELKHLSFHPHLNKKSLEYAANNKKLSDRQDLLMKAKDEYLMRYREKQLQEEMIGCTFTPNLEGSLASSKALQRGGKSTTRTTNDMYIFHRQKLIRLQQRQQLMQSLLARDLTFQPHLNHKSTQLVEKMKKEGRHSVDNVSKQTFSRSEKEKKESQQRKNISNGEEELTYQPKVNARTAYYQPKDATLPIHARLYADSAKAIARKQRAKLKMEECIATFKDKDGIIPTTVVLQNHTTNRNKKKATQNDIVLEPTLNIVTYNHRYDDLISKIDPHFGKTTGA